jgi:putative DNA primase/helicase
MGNSVLFIAEHGARLRYCHPWKSWLGYDGTRWQPDEHGAAPALAKTTVRTRYRRATALLAEAEVLAATDPIAAGKLAEPAAAQIRWAKQSASATRVQAMLQLAQCEPGVPIVPADLNRDLWLFNVLNGTVDLRTGLLLPHSPEHLITKLAPVTFDPAATCPQFCAFLRTILAENPALVEFVQRAIGYSLTGDTREQVLFILYGLGSNGKSTLVDLLHALMGDYAENTPFDTFLAKDRDGIRNELAKLFGARFVDASELDAGRRLAEGLVKAVTGNDPLTARFLFQNSFTFTPTFKLWFSCNHKPQIRGADHAMWRRIRLIPYTVQFHKPEDGPAPAGALLADKTLPARLRAELPGILNWAIAGCHAWKRDGLGLPEAVKKATADYRDEMDTLADFLAECCIVDPQAWVAASALYTAYSTWCERSGEHLNSAKALGLRLRERGFTDGRVGKPQVRGWQGLRLRGTSE